MTSFFQKYAILILVGWKQSSKLIPRMCNVKLRQISFNIQNEKRALPIKEGSKYDRVPVIFLFFSITFFKIIENEVKPVLRIMLFILRATQYSLEMKKMPHFFSKSWNERTYWNSYKACLLFPFLSFWRNY